MSASIHTIREDACRGDGMCVSICGKDVLEIHEGKVRPVSGREHHCIGCGQCVAVCPHDVLQVQGVPTEQVEPLGSWQIPHDAFMAFLRARRSVRAFADKPVDRELITKVLQGAALAPPGFPPQTTEVLVLDQREDLQQLHQALVKGYDKLLKIGSSPVGRLVIRWKRGAEKLHALESHVFKIVRDNNARSRATGRDGYLYNAPVLMLFHGNRWSTANAENNLLVATYAMLTAHSLGLGATLLSIIPPLLNNIDLDLRRSYGIPDDNVVEIAMVLGHPRYRFKKSISRPLRAFRFLRE